jgi:hypothetical protein
MDFPSSISRLILSEVCFDLWGMADVKERFPDNSDDRRIIDIELLSRLDVKRESRSGPTENRVANLAP